MSKRVCWQAQEESILRPVVGGAAATALALWCGEAFRALRLKQAPLRPARRATASTTPGRAYTRASSARFAVDTVVFAAILLRARTACSRGGVSGRGGER